MSHQKERFQDSQSGQEFRKPELEPLLVNHQEAARLLSISPRHLFDLVQRKEITCIKSGHLNLYPLDALRHWIKSKIS
jgi:excisionase family DNA binding protein